MPGERVVLADDAGGRIRSSATPSGASRVIPFGCWLAGSLSRFGSPRCIASPTIST